MRPERGQKRGHHLTSLEGPSSQTPVFQRVSGAPERIRTSDLQLRRLSLYPAELRARSVTGVSEGTRTPNDRSHSPVLYH